MAKTHCAKLNSSFSALNMTMATRQFLCVIVCFLCFALYIKAQPDGWKMTDRFYGFRYQISGSEKISEQANLENIQTKANSMGCFGWVQVNKGSSIVGEARCSKGKGKVFQDWLEQLPEGTRFEKLVSNQILSLLNTRLSTY